MPMDSKMGDSASNERTLYDVAIIGCGPVGATLANHLRLFGHSVAIIERYEDVFFCPRAGGIDDETLRNFDAIGILNRLRENNDLFEADLIMCDSNEIPIGLFNRRRLGDEHTSGYAGYPVVSMFHQPNVEKALRDAYASSPLVESYMGKEMLSLDEQADFVKVTYKNRKDGQGQGEIKAKYVVGCDGARSSVQQALGVGETNYDYSERYLIVDAIVEDSNYLKARFPDGAKMVFDPVYAGVIGKAPHNHVRLDFRIHEDSIIGKQFESKEDYERAARDLIDARNFDLDKLEIVRLVEYQFEARTPEKWRVGRLMIAGDAAHLTPPWSGQGLNMGIRDTANIAFKLHMVLAAKAGTSLLDTYTQEQRPACLKTIKAAVDTGKLMEATNPIVVGLRDLGVRLSGVFPTLARMMASQWQKKPPYKNGFFGSSHPAAGSWMIQPWVTDNHGNLQPMDRLIGPNFALISTDSAIGENVYRFVTELDGVVLKLGADFGDHDGKFMRWCKRNCVTTVLMRPDRYVFDAGTNGDALCASLFDELERYGESRAPKKIGKGEKMLGLRIFNGLNGLLYFVYGLIGVFMPSVVFEANALQAVAVHGSHSIRALWGAIFILGALLLWKGQKPETARMTALMITLVSLGLVTARLFGIAVDGTEGWVSDQRGPLFIESAMAVIGGLLVWRTK